MPFSLDTTCPGFFLSSVCWLLLLAWELDDRGDIDVDEDESFLSVVEVSVVVCGFDFSECFASRDSSELAALALGG